MTFQGKNLDLDSNVGYAIECDLSFPPGLCDYFDAYPPLAIKRCVQRNEYSKYMLDLAHKYGLPPSRDDKLINDLTVRSEGKVELLDVIW